MRSEIYGIVSDIIELASSFDVISFGWISRERNLNADKLAKLCLLEVEAFMAITCLAFVTREILCCKVNLFIYGNIIIYRVIITFDQKKKE